MTQKIGWISIANDNYGSTRIGVTNIHKALLKAGVFSMILNYNKTYAIEIDTDLQKLKNDILHNRLTTVIIQKVCGPKAVAITNFCLDQGIQTVYATGDWNENSMLDLCSKIIVGSPYMRDILNKKYVNKAHFIDDAIETKGSPFKLHTEGKLKLGWYGNYTKMDYALDFIKDLGHNLMTISNTSKADISMGAATDTLWDVDFLIETLFRHIDVVVVPIDITGKLTSFAKTSNRVTLPMSLGIPVIATPIPSYKRVIKHCVNGYLPTDREEWLSALDNLSHLKYRNKIGFHSSKEVRETHSLETIAKKWMEVLSE